MFNRKPGKTRKQKRRQANVQASNVEDVVIRDGMNAYCNLLDSGNNLLKLNRIIPNKQVKIDLSIY